jgi:signal peptidase II
MQAARGASLTGDHDGPRPDDPATASRSPARRGALLVFALVALAAYAVDLTTKVLAVAHLTGRPDVHLVGDLVVLHLVRNPGAAFSTGTAYTEVFSCVAITAVVAVLWFARRLGSSLWAVGLGLLLAGVAGNLTDRLVREPGVLRGHVIDFVMLPHWPVFNVADMCIDVAAALVLLQVYRGVRLDGTRGERDSRGSGDPGASSEAGAA